MPVSDYLPGFGWANELEDYRASTYTLLTQPQQRANMSKKRKAVKEDAGSDKITKISDERPGKKSKSHSLMLPKMAETDRTVASVFPSQHMRPNRGLRGATVIEEEAVLSAAEKEEFMTLLAISDYCLFERHASDDLLKRTPRFSVELPDQVTPLSLPQKRSNRISGLDPGRPPISTIDGIFDDIAINATKLGLREALPPSALRIATMCSGTEAPLLGMTLMQQALRRQGETSFEVSHIFSAEIEHYKQAYIERNFSPSLLFRDVTEFRHDKDAHTAYGGTAKQPHDVHILVAGSSCVDYSSLNQKRKEWADEGQSYRTLEGIQSYAERARPNIIILENVKSAPWAAIKRYLNDIGYASNHVLVDTKNYYLPQTRERGYLIAFDKGYLKKYFKIEDALKEWEKLMYAFQRRANAPFSDFIYDDDDPELHEAKFDSESVDAASKTMDWAACRHRYAKHRVEKLYGSLRPMTHWQNNGSCKFPDFGWIKWSKIQRERIWDTLDIEYLRHAGERDYDINYKIRWLELSQNVDRDSDSRQWGIVSCLTPSGMPYLTTRGGPVSGGESLLLQGIPKYALNLTKETPRQLQNLAGNAMSVPVVTSAILGGILAVCKGMEGSGQNYFKDFSEHDKLKNSTNFVATKAAPAAICADEMLRAVNADSGILIQVGSLANSDADHMLRAASTTLQFCKCEGTSATKQGHFQICEDCGHMTCKTCGQNPVHKYRDIAGSITESRGSPAEFKTMITKALPTILQFSITDGSSYFNCLEPMPKHQSCKEEFQQAVQLAFHSTVKFKHVKRGHSWKVAFEGPHSRLELRISRKCCPSAVSEGDFFGREAVECHWFLFAKAPAKAEAGDAVRAALQHPIARMIPQVTLLSGKWEIMRYSRVTLDIKAANGDRMPSWESSIGLQDDKFRHLQRAAALQVSVSPMESDEAKEIGRRLTGTYVLRSKCGAASASLHVRRETASEKHSQMFFFLEPEQLKNEFFDSFVFSTTNFRRGYKEYRMVQAEVDEGWRPLGLSTAQESLDEDFSTQSIATEFTSAPIQGKGNSKNPRARNSAAKPKISVAKTRAKLPITTFQNWVSCDTLNLSVPATMNNQHLWMSSNFEVTMLSETACSQASTFMLIELPVETYKGSDWKPGYQFAVKVAGQHAALDNFRWLLERAAAHMLANLKMPRQVTVAGLSCVSCTICAPRPPSIEYAQVEVVAQKNKQTHDAKAVENKIEATKYERALKERPSPIVAIVHCHESSATLEIKLNIPALCHQVLAKLCSPQHHLLQQPIIEWSLAGDHGREKAPKFQVKPFLNNENETRCAKPKHFDRDLWREQSKALTWMVHQELDPCEWHEQERKEVSVPALGCRIDVEARMLKKVRGGILADEVGGGKTTTSLALVAKMLEIGNGEQMPEDPQSMSVDATLILVPSGLLKQWKDEINACFGSQDAERRLVLKTTDELLKLKLSDLRRRDIILASWNIFEKAPYWAALEGLSGARNKPSKAGRAFQHWLRKAIKDLSRLTQESQGDETHDVWQKTEGFEIVDGDGLVQKKDACDSLEAINKHDAEKRAEFLPLFHACTFRRIIIDEYSYLQGHSFLAALELKSTSMWLLSGTPPVSNFDVINTTAKLLKTKLTSEDEKDGCFSFVTKGTRLTTDKTDAEQFQWYKNERSPAWLRARNQLVDSFIEKFVRKNSPEAAKGIQRLSHYEVSLLSAHEQIVYFEVFQRLMSQNVKFKTAANKSTSAMTRSERLDMTVYVSEHPEDALLSCCSEVSNIYQNANAMTNPEEMCTPVIRDTRLAIEVLIRELYENLREAFAYEKQRKPDEEDIKKKPHFLSFKLRIRNNDVGDKFAAELIDRVMMVAHDRRRLPTVPYERRTFKNPGRIQPTVQELAAVLRLPGAEHGNEVDEDEDEDTNFDAESEELEPDAASETTSVVEHEDSSVDSGQAAVSAASQNRVAGRKYLADFQASMREHPKFMDEIVPKGSHTAESKARRAQQSKFRRDDLKVRTDEQKSRSEDMNMTTIDIVNQIRVLRLFGNVRLVLRGEELPQCSGCGMKDQKLSDLFIMGICGHIACYHCLQDEEIRTHDPNGCLDKLCNAPGLRHHLIEAARFSPGQMSPTTTNGSKMDAVVCRVNSIIESTSDSVLIFVQFPRILKALTKALTASGVLHQNAATGEKSDSKVESFRKGNGHRVLILLIDSANAAGW